MVQRTFIKQNLFTNTDWANLLFVFRKQWPVTCPRSIVKLFEIGNILIFLYYLCWGQVWRWGTNKCKLSRLWIRFPLEDFYYLFVLVSSRSVASGSSTQHAIRGKIGNGIFLMGMECFNTKFPGCSCLLCYEYVDTEWSLKKT